MPDENQRANYSAQAVDQAAKLLRNGGASTLLLMTGSALTEHGLDLAGRIAGKTGCKVMTPTSNPRVARGRGRFSIDRIPYVIEHAMPILKEFKHIVLVEAGEPVAFFAYPNKPSLLKPQGCEVHRMTSGAENSVAALEALADALHAQRVRPPAAEAGRTDKADRRADACLDRAGDCDARSRRTPSWSTNRSRPAAASFRRRQRANPHDWLQNMGGSIGLALPSPPAPRWRVPTAR